MVGLAEIQEMLGRSRARTNQLVQVKGFPDPVATLYKSGHRIWERKAVQSWIDKRNARLNEQGNS